jgi:hypothetical protein
MEYPPTREHTEYLAGCGAEEAIIRLKQTDGEITILKYCNMKGVIFNPKHYAGCDYVVNTFNTEKYPNLKIIVKVGEID